MVNCKEKRTNVKRFIMKYFPIDHREENTMFQTLFYLLPSIMEIQRMTTTRTTSATNSQRVIDRWSFIGQKHLIKIVKTALAWAKRWQSALWHMLLTWPSGHGKTTLARLIADDRWVHVHHITAYALNKPADIISLLNSLHPHDIVFIDELHRCKPIIEEVLYVAMEDFAIDMILPDGKPLRINLNPFTLIGATTKPEWLSAPLKNRFVYKLHFMEYTAPEKELLLQNQLARLGITIQPPELIQSMCLYSTSVPREIGNLSKQLLDWLMAHFWCDDLHITPQRRNIFRQDLQLQQWWLTPLHQAYLNLLEESGDRPMGIKTISTTLWVHEKTLEEEIEPLLLKLKKIEKTTKGRIIFRWLKMPE